MTEADDLAELYTVPPHRFVAERNALVKQLRADGERERAGEIGKLKKPTVPAWAVNSAARSDPKAVGRVIAAGERLAGAQRSGDGEELREAMAETQSAIEDMMDRVTDALRSEDQDRPANVDRARETLRAVATDEELRAELESARVTRDREPVGFGAAPASAPRRPPAESNAADAKRRKQLQRVKAAERTLTTAGKRADRARARRDQAKRDLDRAQKSLDQAEAELAAASDELDAAKADAKR